MSIETCLPSIGFGLSMQHFPAASGCSFLKMHVVSFGQLKPAIVPHDPFLPLGHVPFYIKKKYVSNVIINEGIQAFSKTFFTY
jgi:hypothetical protein